MEIWVVSDFPDPRLTILSDFASVELFAEKFRSLGLSGPPVDDGAYGLPLDPMTQGRL